MFSPGQVWFWPLFEGNRTKPKRAFSQGQIMVMHHEIDLSWEKYDMLNRLQSVWHSVICMQCDLVKSSVLLQTSPDLILPTYKQYKSCPAHPSNTRTQSHVPPPYPIRLLAESRYEICMMVVLMAYNLWQWSCLQWWAAVCRSECQASWTYIQSLSTHLSMHQIYEHTHIGNVTLWQWSFLRTLLCEWSRLGEGG